MALRCFASVNEGRIRGAGEGAGAKTHAEAPPSLGPKLLLLRVDSDLPAGGSPQECARRGDPLRLPAGPPEVRSGGGAGRLRRHARASHAKQKAAFPLNASTDIGTAEQRDTAWGQISPRTIGGRWKRQGGRGLRRDKRSIWADEEVIIIKPLGGLLSSYKNSF
ncbi:hypothetical protein SKAU_G00385720 [Synaphobranchus kaupii]|uniref:Uncharacterized protein n=1 Tax=Synaphobranchus kaupii TaxID=118154 RepID=A0A9Q1IF28_SYNKA|nr:hypothetical protein SKAU_G00385720 [Synaphobranchus kaupii]